MQDRRRATSAGVRYRETRLQRGGWRGARRATGPQHSRGVRSSSCRNAAVRGAPILPAGVVYLATSTRLDSVAKKRTVVELDEAALAAAQGAAAPRP